MKKLFIVILALSFVIGCTDRKENKTEMSSNDNLKQPKQNNDSLQKARAVADSIRLAKQKDSTLVKLTEEIFTAIKNEDYKTFTTYIHPTEGIRFSPYAFVDTIKHKKFSKAEFVNLVNQADGKMIVWGQFDGSGEPIKMNLNSYMKRFVYDADFLKPEKRSVNKFIGGGNSLNNLLKVYKDCDFTESYFSGFDKKYEGMDWKTLRLVFKEMNKQFYLVGIVHDEWTI